jgi:LTXXQ motif family protein
MKFATTLLVTTMLASAPAWAQTTGTGSVPAPATPAPAVVAPAPGAAAPDTAGTEPKRTEHHARAASIIPSDRTMETMVGKRINDLHRELHITSGESTQWDQFAQVMRDNAKEIDQAYADRAQKLESMSAVENMQSYAQIEQLRAQQVQKLVPAFQALYASLSDQQKQTADALFQSRAARAHAHRQAAEGKHAIN